MRKRWREIYLNVLWKELTCSSLCAGLQGSKDERHSSHSSGAGGLTGQWGVKGNTQSIAIEAALGAEGMEILPAKNVASWREQDDFLLGPEG